MAHLFRHLTDDGLVGDGSNVDANVNGVVTEVPFYAGPAPGKIWRVERMLISIQDNAIFNVENYGGVSALANGVRLDIRRPDVAGAVTLDLLDGEPVHSMFDWAQHCYDYAYHSHGSGNNMAAVRWTFSKSGAPLTLSGQRNEILVATVDDDLSTLVSHHFIIQGQETDE